ncbi:MAG: hypothetical protein GWO38_06395 [Phycisphaerae bacterium]|nr:hypothetical protein [Phycisphaerae bacterium]NIX27263.1 hypothetical protein [Phycisphaerae bacterium]
MSSKRTFSQNVAVDALIAIIEMHLEEKDAMASAVHPNDVVLGMNYTYKDCIDALTNLEPDAVGLFPTEGTPS